MLHSSNVLLVACCWISLSFAIVNELQSAVKLPRHVNQSGKFLCDDCIGTKLNLAGDVHPRSPVPGEIMYHLHISKTGGTTFEKLLKKAAHELNLEQKEKVPDSARLILCDEALNSSFHPPFRFGPLFASPEALLKSGCNVASAEGKFKDVATQFGGKEPQILIWMREPVARTL